MHGMAPAFLLGVNRLAKEESRDTLVQLKESVLSLDSHFMSLFILTLLLDLLVLFFLLYQLLFGFLLGLLLKFLFLCFLGCDYVRLAELHYGYLNIIAGLEVREEILI